MDPLRYFYTLRYLRPVQIYGRVAFRLFRPQPDLSPAPPLRVFSGRWVLPARRGQSLVGPACCRFLNEEHEIASSVVWNDPVQEKLWQYNLHYFDDLNAEGAVGRTAWHRALIGRWVAENPPGRGTGWEPYPTSLRIVNWIKWVFAGNHLEPEWLHSLAVQARWLVRRLEVHLLGNHLFANAKALVFAGIFFDGPEAAVWLEKGMAILAREAPEQILRDGGHFERSPMYHALVVEDILDLVNLTAAFPEAVPKRRRGFVASWSETVGRMRVWLAAMCHPDGEIAFFNDAAIGIAPSPMELAAYAGRLGLPALNAPRDGVTHFADSGYIRVQRGEMVALLDVAPIGPDYLPGHAHADTLSFELSLWEWRVLVNSGTSRYSIGPERLRQRGTAAHNTVTIDGQDSSEVWAGFRVARRARPFGLRIDEDKKGLRVSCAHDGYTRLPGRPIHVREWRFSNGALEIADTIEGRFRQAVSRLFLPPGLEPSDENSAETGHAGFAEGRGIAWRVEGARARVVPATYHPAFGAAKPNRCLEMQFAGSRCTLRLTWD